LDVVERGGVHRQRAVFWFCRFVEEYLVAVRIHSLVLKTIRRGSIVP
jgi:hypothetical protein